MKRQIANVLMLFGFALALAGCDKCGNFGEIRYPKLPDACRGGAPTR